MTQDGAGLGEVSSYLRYLPAIYWEDQFIGRFLRIFEDVLTPVQQTVNALPQHFDPSLTSLPMLDFLSSWVGAGYDQELPETVQRRLVKASLYLHSRRGTKAGLRLALELACGHRPYITEYSPGLVLGQDAVMGLNTSLEGGTPLRFHVVFDCPAAAVDQPLAHAIIRRYKPAHASYTLSFAAEGQPSV